MLAKYSDSFDVVSSSTILNTKNVDTNVSVSDIAKDGGKSDSLGIDSYTLNGIEEFDGVNEENGTENWVIPEGFQLLPEDLFLFGRIPPPLVSSSWLKSLDSDEEVGEDSIPLAKLRKKIKKKRTKKTAGLISSLNSDNQDTDRRKKKKQTENEYSPIIRKRGRPKKQTAEKTNSESEFQFEENDHFWNEDTNISIPDALEPAETEIKIENDDSGGNNCNEHDYSKPVENWNEGDVKDEGNEGKVKKKKKRTPIQGVKVGDSKISFPCLECGKSFSAVSTLKCHQRLHNGTLLICPECHKGFVSKYLLKCHMRIHNGDLFMCHKCGRGFTTAELLKVHSRAHTGDRPFACNICGKSFPTSSNMLQHKQIHNSEKKFLCSQCGSSFVQKRCLDYHMLTHTEKKNICNACGKLWARKSDLVEHMRVHTGVKPYCCSICPQKFSQASSLKRHQLVHMDVKSIQCGTCYKMFKCQEYYKRHLRKHEKGDCSS